MTDPVKEQLSACLDGELPEAELDLLLKQVQRDPRLQQSVTRYGLIGEVLRTGSSPTPSTGFAARISEAIAAESAPQSNQPAAAAVARRALPRWVRPVGGAAIAAGVAAVAVMALQPQITAWQQGGGVPELANVPASSYVVPPNTPNTPILPAAQAAYLAKYMLPHSEYAGPLQRRAVLSSVLADDESDLIESVDMTTPADAPSEADASTPLLDSSPDSSPDSSNGPQR